ncbi:family 10 glycosylhydrolase [Altericista sp. CCNU0014]|uniref:family 10 glycosylhydrolase n=1 Tax=Altericista sp. CCNU0014 TaxID=3082949 RepID=UPI0038514F04
MLLTTLHTLRARIRQFRLRLPLLFLIALLSTQGLAQATLLSSQRTPSDIRGVWLTINDSVIWRDRANTQKAVTDLARLNFNTIYPVVWNSGYTLYPSAVARQAKIQDFVPKGKQGQDTLADIITKGHQQGLRVIPWMEFGFMTPPSSELALQHPDWLTQQANGNRNWVGAAGEVVWLNPFHPEVQTFFSNLVTEVVSRYDGDGIQFDDHTSLPNSFGYDPYTLSLYAKETKKTGMPHPNDPHWVSWRANKISSFIEQLNKRVKAIRPNAVFSVAPNPYDTAYKGYLQDWLGWIRKGWVDELIVQIYRPTLESFMAQATRPELTEARQKIPTGAGILTGLQNQKISMAQIQAQTRAAQSIGLGVTYFYYESLWDEAPEPIAQRQSQFQTLLATNSLQSRSR